MEEIIFGKNAVLAFLEQAPADETAEHKQVQDSFMTAALDHARAACHREGHLESLDQSIQQAVDELRKKTPPEALAKDGEGLKLTCRPADILARENNLTVRVNKILLAEGLERDGRVRKIKKLARIQRIPVQICERKKLDQLAGPQRRHQGVVAMVSPADLWKLDTFLQKLVLDRILRELDGENMDGYVVAVLDGVEDPHNLGAIIRVAEAAGVKAVFLPQRRSAGLTGTVAKTSAGALANLPVVRVGNLVQCLETLKKYGFWIAALDVEARELYTDADLVRPLVVVIGSEGQGVSRLVKEHCDFLLKIPMLGKTESLNASVSAGIMFYEIVRQLRSRSKIN